MHLTLVDINPEVVQAWAKVFADVPEVNVQSGSIFDHPCDALVSPANSYGHMNGGIDFAISKTLGWHIETLLQEKLRKKHYGELLVGQAEIIETQHEDFPYLISAPTMRLPMSINRTPNVYHAMRAILILVRDGHFDDGANISEAVKTIAVPGLGTGVGQVSGMVCALQMRLAWEDIMNQMYATESKWDKLRENFKYFYTEDPKDIAYDIVPK
ncbi:macro domain-containing protein [Microscilla marina]|uniref:Phage tail assembly protein n=1 Tax=Microscilla marina ATCC 23134 TaxID=313606 RepID=A1ZQH2_MICM2|nr:macro domain-containing protein [Microscilla marina]EAY27344.1 phage tail assembly protein [Microscilla marina ATCC 23134]